MYSMNNFSLEGIARKRSLRPNMPFSLNTGSGGQPEAIDQPLAILAALHWIEKKSPMFDILRSDIDKHSPRRNGFEDYSST